MKVAGVSSTPNDKGIAKTQSRHVEPGAAKSNEMSKGKKLKVSNRGLGGRSASVSREQESEPLEKASEVRDPQKCAVPNFRGSGGNLGLCGKPRTSAYRWHRSALVRKHRNVKRLSNDKTLLPSFLFMENKMGIVVGGQGGTFSGRKAVKLNLN
ncbi:MAG: hypothetical protein LBS87_01560 [Puniceicoccales bacterium]|jgi:hypothetical protein|nr:hypothetical protein [Puniceicoccales bacterium]